MLVLKIIGWIILLLLAAFVSYAVFTIICSFLVDPRKEYEHNSRFYRFLLDSWTAIAMPLLRLRISASGLEKIPKDTRFVIVCNHRSNLDPIVTWYLLRDYDIAFISKEANFHVPFFGRIIRKCCFLPIDRVNPRNALITINKAVDLIKRNEVSIGVYPEGTRNRTDAVLLPFHNGVFKIAQWANVPLVVATVKGTEQVNGNFPFRPTKITFEVLDVIRPEELPSGPTKEIGKKIECMMRENLIA